MIRETEGDLIELAVDGQFDVVAHGCNCMGTTGRGLAVSLPPAGDVL